MKRIATISALLALVFGIGAAVAQEGRKGGFDPAQMVERQLTVMKERLKLTDDQEKKLKPILTDQTKKMQEIMQKYRPEQGQPISDEARSAMLKAREETTAKINEVLTKDQQAEYQKMMSERRGRGGPGGDRQRKNQ